jgi:CheY-like chemotaxis protein
MANVLIVDDDADAREPLQTFLEHAGHVVRCAAGGREALAEVLRAMPDVVVLDMFMSDMDGPSFLEVVRSYLRIQSLPVVVVTGLTESPMVDRLQRLKVNAVLAKGKATLPDIRRAVEDAAVRLPG